MQAEFNTNLVKNLPDAYRKTTDSNNFKILEIERIACDDLRSGLRQIYNTHAENEADEGILNIDNARGKTLDLYGDRVRQARGVATDSQYLLMIKAKIMRNISNGSYPSILNAMCGTFSCDPSQVLITDGEQPCTVKIVSLPLAAINNAGLSTSQTLAIVKSMLPVGISIETFMFGGTFELAFSYEDMKVDGETKGLTDTYENLKNRDAIGGYLGVTVGDENEEILPI